MILLLIILTLCSSLESCPVGCRCRRSKLRCRGRVGLDLELGKEKFHYVDLRYVTLNSVTCFDSYELGMIKSADMRNTTPTELLCKLLDCGNIFQVSLLNNPMPDCDQDFTADPTSTTSGIEIQSDTESTSDGEETGAATTTISLIHWNNHCFCCCLFSIGVFLMLVVRIAFCWRRWMRKVQDQHLPGQIEQSVNHPFEMDDMGTSV